MAAFTVSIKGLDGVVEKLEGFDDTTADKVAGVIQDTVDDIERDAKRLCPVDTGRLRASIEGKVDDSGMSGEVGTDVDYAPSIEFGSKAHVIKPKRGKFLIFHINGEWVKARQVNHPGNRPKPFLFPAFEMNKQKCISRLNKILSDMLR